MNNESTNPVQGEGGFRPDISAATFAPTEGDYRLSTPAATFVPERDPFAQPTKPQKTKEREQPEQKKTGSGLWTHLVRAVVVLAILFGMYLTAVFSDIPFIAKWRTIYIQTAMQTLRHKWLATYFIPGFVIDEAMSELEQSRSMQIGVNSTWEDGLPALESDTILTKNPTLVNTAGMSQQQIDFYNDFWELDVASMEAYVQTHPECVANGWDRININEAGLDAEGTSIQTHMGEQVLAINAYERILIVREKGSSYRGVLAVCKDPTRLSMQFASTIGTTGQSCGTIAAAHNGIIGVTASGFLDEGGVGDGADPVGFSICNGEAYGYHMPSGYKRLELHEDNRMYIRDAQDEVAPTVTDCVEFSPAIIVDGVNVLEGNGWGWSDLQPRACVGQSVHGEILMLLIEGRRPGISIGISVGDCAGLLIPHECMQALNVDGGTSAMIWYDGAYIMESSNPVLTQGRLLPNAFVYERKP